MKHHDKECLPKDIQLKSFFLGPQSENGDWLLDVIQSIFKEWIQWRKRQFPEDGCAISTENKSLFEFLERQKQIKTSVSDLLRRFEQEVPKFSPRYVGHMMSEISLPALFGHIVTLLHNPNNISGESSLVGIKIESEAVDELMRMVGYPTSFGKGHFTSGGTIANFEALLRARSRHDLWLSVSSALAFNQKESSSDVLYRGAHLGWDLFDQLLATSRSLGLTDQNLKKWKSGSVSTRDLLSRFDALQGATYHGPVLLVPENKHYSWQKGAKLVGLSDDSIWPIELNESGQLDIGSLKHLLIRSRKENRSILMCVSVVGTTELGSVDAVHGVQELLDQYQNEFGIYIWHHVDAAYGGFFCSLDFSDTVLNSEASKALQTISKANSITMDPHKLGYVPYASGAFLVRESRDYYFSNFSNAPYIDFDPSEDKGPYTIEGSRSAAGAVATWMTAKTMGFNSKGYGALIERTLRIKKELQKKIQEQIPDLQMTPGTDTNILCFLMTQKGDSLSVSNQKTLSLYQKFSVRSKSPFTVSKTALHYSSYGRLLAKWSRSWSAQQDADEVILIRMVLMNPFFGSSEMNVQFIDEFVKELGSQVAQLRSHSDVI